MSSDSGVPPEGRVKTIAAVSIALAIVVMGIKYVAYLVTGSVALYSDALESVVNVAAGVAAWAAIRVSAKPADRNHSYGHHKAELLSAAFEGALIIVAALLIVLEATHALIHPRELEAPALGLLINGVATATCEASSYRDTTLSLFVSSRPKARLCMPAADHRRSA